MIAITSFICLSPPKLTAVWAGVAAVQPLEPVNRVKLRAKSANVASTRWFYEKFRMFRRRRALLEQRFRAQKLGKMGLLPRN
jgi:hypothetical protein